MFRETPGMSHCLDQPGIEAARKSCRTVIFPESPGELIGHCPARVEKVIIQVINRLFN